jgi:Tol biopolymer transport system component
MPDVQEVFRMATQKARPDPGALDRQHRDQQWRVARKKTAVFATVIGINALRTEEGSRPGGSVPTPSPAPAIDGAGQALSIVDIGSGTETAFTASLGASGFDVSLDGSMVAYTDLDENGNTQLFVMDADGSNIRQLTQGESGTPRGADWSPDGSMVAFERDTSDNSQIFVVRLSDGVSTQVTQEPRGAVDPAGWAPDGGMIVFSTVNAAGNQYTARSLDLATGETRLIVPDASTPELSPDGAWIAFNSWLKSPGPRLFLANSDGSGRRIIARLSGDDGYEEWSPDSTQVAFFGSIGEDGFGTYVYDLATGETRFVTVGTIESWIDDDHILVS